MFVRRMFAVLLLVATAGLAFVTPASAHTSLKSSNPAKGASLAAAPSEIVLTFSEPVQVEPGAITVTGPSGAQWTVGQVAVAGPVVTAPVTPAGPAGQYTINYRVISADGDPVRGTVPFTLTAAVPSATSTPPTTSSSSQVAQTPTTNATVTQAPAPAAQQTGDSGGIPIWVWIVGAVVVVAAGVVLGGRAGKRKTSQDAQQ